VDLRDSLANTSDTFCTLRSSGIAVVSGAANNYSIDGLAQFKTLFSQNAEAVLAQPSH